MDRGILHVAAKSNHLSGWVTAFIDCSAPPPPPFFPPVSVYGGIRGDFERLWIALLLRHLPPFCVPLCISPPFTLWESNAFRGTYTMIKIPPPENMFYLKCESSKEENHGIIGTYAWWGMGGYCLMDLVAEYVIKRSTLEKSREGRRKKFSYIRYSNKNNPLFVMFPASLLKLLCSLI